MDEPTNEDRADWADTAIEAFMAETGTDREDALGDLLGDPMHWADREGKNYGDAIMSATSNYGEECDELSGLDSAHLSVLDSIGRSVFGDWYYYYPPWVYDTPIGTERVLEALAKKGLVRRGTDSGAGKHAFFFRIGEQVTT